MANGNGVFHDDDLPELSEREFWHAIRRARLTEVAAIEQRFGFGRHARTPEQKEEAAAERQSRTPASRR